MAEHSLDTPLEPVRTGRGGLVAAAVVLYLAGLAWLSLARGGAWSCTGRWLLEQGGASRADLLVNVLAYLPLGALLAGGAGRRPLRVALAIAVAAAFSLTVEALQACMPARVSSWTDLLANMAGAGLGTLLPGFALRSARGLDAGRLPGLPAGAMAPEPLRALALLTLSAWILGRTFPWVLTLDVGQLRANLAFLRPALDGELALDAWRLLRHVAAWLVLGLTVRAVLKPWAPVMRITALVVLGVLGVQLLLSDPTGSLEELLGLAIALPGLVLFRLPDARRWLPHGLAASAFLMAAAYELQPAHGPAGVAFAWLPAFGAGSQSGALQMGIFFFGFAFACALATAWRDAPRSGRSGSGFSSSTAGGSRAGAEPSSGHHGRSRRHGRRSRRHRRNHTAIAFAASIGWLVLLELAQVWIPGRIVDPSPPLLAAVGWGIAMSVRSRFRDPASSTGDRSSP